MNEIQTYSWNTSDIFPAPIKECPINIVQCVGVDSSPFLRAYDFLEIAIVANGEGFYKTETASYPIRQGDVFLIPKNHAHAYSSSQEIKVNSILLRNNLVFQAFPEILTEPALCCFRDLEPRFRKNDNFQNHLRLSEEELKTLLTFWEFMNQENTLQSEHSSNVLWALLHCFLVHLCRYFGKHAGNRGQKLMKLADVMKYIEQHYSAPISCKELVKLAGQNRLAFNDLFQQATGHAPREYILLFRLTKAKERLRNTTMSIKEIAADCGFCDAGYFCQQFKKRCALSPRQYREESGTETEENILGELWG